MTVERLDNLESRTHDAAAELQEMISQRYPTAHFALAPEEDPSGLYLTVMVDSDDPDEVMDVVIDRLLTLQIEEGLPVYVVPIRSPERVTQLVRSSVAHRFVHQPKAMLS